MSIPIILNLNIIGIDIDILTASDIIILGVCKWENNSHLPVLKFEPVKNKYFKSVEFFNSFFNSSYSFNSF